MKASRTLRRLWFVAVVVPAVLGLVATAATGKTLAPTKTVTFKGASLHVPTTWIKVRQTETSLTLHARNSGIAGPWFVISVRDTRHTLRDEVGGLRAALRDTGWKVYRGKYIQLPAGKAYRIEYHDGTTQLDKLHVIIVHAGHRYWVSLEALDTQRHAPMFASVLKSLHFAG